MALAALGDPARFRDLFARAVRTTREGFVLDPALFPPRVLTSGYARTSPQLVATTCPPRRPDEAIEEIHRDLAAALQERTDQIVLHLARRSRLLTGSRRLCVGGGVATNCVGIGRIIDEQIFDEIFVRRPRTTPAPPSGPPLPYTSTQALRDRCRGSREPATSGPPTPSPSSTSPRGPD